MVGGSLRVARSLSLISESWLFLGKDFELSQQPFGVALPLLQRSDLGGRRRRAGRGGPRGRLPGPVALVLVPLRPGAARVEPERQRGAAGRACGRRAEDDNGAMRLATRPARRRPDRAGHRVADDGRRAASAAVGPRLEPFPLRDVRLLDGPFLEMQRRGLAYLLSLDPDRLLHTFRAECRPADDARSRTAAGKGRRSSCAGTASATT